MPIHILKLINKREIANSTVAFTFEKPQGFTFKPGQYGGFTLIQPAETDAAGNTRRFSLLSTPADAQIEIAMRIQSSAFKRMLNALPLGSEVKFAGPTGIFTLHEDINVPAVFIAGGIGITPFYCMIRDRTAQRSTQPITLFYGNQTPNDAPFLTELIQLQEKNSHFKCIVTMANPDASWKGEIGFISHTLLKKTLPDLNAPIYYICGSPAMVTALQETLAEMGVDEDRIKTEDFPGY